MRRAALLALLLAACQPAAPEPATANESLAGRMVPTPADDPAPAAPALTLSGYDGIRLGQEVADARPTLTDTDDFDESCKIYGNDALPSFYVIAEDGIIKRVTASKGYEKIPDSPIKTDRGIGVGDPEAKVRAAYPGLKQSPHTYTDGIYLDWLPDGEDKPGLRFEVTEGKVTDIHAGVAPVLFYVEGCA